MIAQLEGAILQTDDNTVTLGVGGVGFLLHIPTRRPYHVGETARFYTYLHVRENELTLYGFAEPEAKQLFILLLGVSGVGPKAALSILNTFSPDTLQLAILNRQPEVLARAPGVGRKTGEAIVLHLKDRLTQLAGPGGPAITEDDADVIAALTGLGFSLVEAQRAVQQLSQETALSVEEKIRRALTLLGR